MTSMKKSPKAPRDVNVNAHRIFEDAIRSSEEPPNRGNLTQRRHQRHRANRQAGSDSLYECGAFTTICGTSRDPSARSALWVYGA